HGIDDLRAITMRRGSSLTAYGARATLDAIEKKFRYIFDAGVRPLPGTSKPELGTRPVEPGRPFTVGDVEVLPFEVPHGPLNVLPYRIGRLGYVTDAKSLPAAALEALRGVSVLVLSALLPTEHPTHLSIPEAIAAAQQVGAERTYFTHLTHRSSHADLEAE